MERFTMTTASQQITKTANLAGAKRFGESRKPLRLTDEVMRAAQAIWPRKTAAELSVITGSGVRACEYWLSRKTEMSADALVALLRSESGLEILEAVIGDARPSWWKAFARTIELSRLRKAQDDTRRRLERLELDL
jgi:hypothetical protein